MRAGAAPPLLAPTRASSRRTVRREGEQVSCRASPLNPAEPALRSGAQPALCAAVAQRLRSGEAHSLHTIWARFPMARNEEGWRV
mmetsp:Transcript_42022/g.103642  ORF Transcript_42022/g.103642 Transcript_42022/m.103642 type:complete len:85 (+) Transcript_42022:479-733(+)